MASAARPAPPPLPRPTMRIDKLLWFLRIVKTRSAGQSLAETGHVRRNGTRIERAAAAVGIGDVLVIPAAFGVRVVEIMALPDRRGPPAEAQACYRTLDGPAPLPLAPAVTEVLKGELQP